MLQNIKSGVKWLLAKQGYALLNTRNYRATMECAFQSILKRHPSLNTVIDIGASDGRWSAAFMRYFPRCHYLLVEAQPVHEPKLKQFCAQHPQAAFALAAAGEAVGVVNFDASAPLGGQASHLPYAEHNLVVPMTSIDHEVQARQLAQPYLLKFDTHGYEIPILKGARQTLRATEVIIMECYNFNIAPDAVLFYEMCAYLKDLGFRCIDLVDPAHRPYDQSFWQMDLVFVKDTLPEFSYLAYQ